MSETKQEEEKPVVMHVIAFGPTAEVAQIDTWPEGTKRSVKGALHISPGATKQVTLSELAYLKKLRVPLRVIPVPDPTKKSYQAPQDGAPAPTPDAPGVVESAASGAPGAPETGTGGGFKKKKPK